MSVDMYCEGIRLDKGLFKWALAASLALGVAVASMYYRAHDEASADQNKHHAVAQAIDSTQPDGLDYCVADAYSPVVDQ